MATLKVKFDTLTFALGEANVVIATRPLLTDARLVWAHRHIWTITGVLLPTSSETVNQRMQTIKDAFANQFGAGVSIVNDDGSPTNMTLMANSTVSQTVRVTTAPSFPNTSGGGAMNTHLRFYAVVEGEVPVLVSSQGDEYASFTESLSFASAPLFGYLDVRKGVPKIQRLRQVPIQRIVQRGRAVGLYRFPLVPPAVFLGNQIGPAWIRGTSPSRWGRGNNPRYTHFQKQWEYRFESPFDLRLSGDPNFWV